MIASFKKLSTIFLNSNTNPRIYSPFIFHGTSTSFKETFYKVIEYYKPRIIKYLNLRYSLSHFISVLSRRV